MNTRAIGSKAEDIAWQFLRNKGYLLVCKNYRCRFGEIDLIIEKNELTVFVEVKSRTDDELLTALEQVNRSKQRKIIKSAQHYLYNAKKINHQCRFDVIAIVKLESAQPEITWIADAFIHNWN